MQVIASRPLGHTGLSVSELGFGAAPIGDLYTHVEEAEAFAAVTAARAAGITLFDTSPHYGNGLSELRLGAGLRQQGRDGIVLSTKIGRVMDPRHRPAAPTPGVVSPGFAGGLPHRAAFDYSYDGTLRSFEHSLLRLGTDRIDLLLIHDVDVWTHGEQFETRFREAMDGAYQALVRLRDEGVVRAIGVGINEAAICARFAEAGDFDVVLMAGHYSLLEQGAAERLLPIALARGIGVILGGVYNSGILATGAIPEARFNYRPAPPPIIERVRRMEEICREYRVALAEVALRFALAHPAVSAVVLGMVTPAEVARNIAALGRDIPAGVWAELKAAGLLPASAPTP
ncbi:MAG: aldo/keto reductase [Acidobacteriota bacterium]